MEITQTQTTDLALTDLAGRINDEHRLAEDAARSAVEHAVKAGELLIEAKAKVGHGEWGEWVRENCTFAERTAQTYMRVARELPKLDGSKAQRVADLPLRDAMRALAEPPETVKLNFEEVGQSLLETYESKHYVDKGYGTFAEFCKGEMQMGLHESHRYMAAARVMEELRGHEPAFPVLPETESVCRPLTQLGGPRGTKYVPPDGMMFFGCNEGPDTILIMPSTHSGYYYVVHMFTESEAGPSTVSSYAKPVYRDYLVEAIRQLNCGVESMDWLPFRQEPRDYNVFLYTSRQDHIDRALHKKVEATT